MTSTSAVQVCLPGQAAAPEGPVDVVNMYVMHHAFRRDLTRFRAAVHRTSATDRRRWQAMHKRWNLFSTVLHHHHAAEDAGLWPLLVQRAASAGDDTARAVLRDMAAEHAIIDPLLRSAGSGFARLAQEPDETALVELRRVIDDAWQRLADHLAHEEREAMALVQRYLDEAGWQAVERNHFRPAYGPRDLMAVVPWAMLGLPADVRAAAFRAAGTPMKIMWWLTRRSFARTEVEAFGAGAPWLSDLRTPVAVVGATGTVGGLVLKELVSAGAQVRVLVRQERPATTFPAGVQQVVADLRDEQAVREALAGVRAALYVSPHDADEEELADNFARAANHTGTRIVFAGVHVAAGHPLGWLRLKTTGALLPTYRPKLRIGQRIARGNPAPVIFSPSNFFQNDELFEDDILDGVYPLPMRDVNRVDVRDLAELCTRALLQPSYPAGEHTVAGTTSLSGKESARIWAEALGREVRYVGDDESAWIPLFRNRLHGRKFDDLVNTSKVLARHAISMPREAAATAELLGHPQRSYGAYVADRVARSVPRAG